MFVSRFYDNKLVISEFLIVDILGQLYSIKI